MIYPSDLQKLISEWQERADSMSPSSDSQITLQECIYELNELINDILSQEVEYQEMHDEWMADFFGNNEEAEDVA